MQLVRMHISNFAGHPQSEKSLHRYKIANSLINVATTNFTLI